MSVVPFVWMAPYLISLSLSSYESNLQHWTPSKMDASHKVLRSHGVQPDIIPLFLSSHSSFALVPTVLVYTKIYDQPYRSPYRPFKHPCDQMKESNAQFPSKTSKPG